jgi:serine/threonine-protein kinase
MSDVFDRLKATLADRYSIERELGRGGMATVYLAHDLKHDRKVAVKVLHPELAAVLGAERFLNEIKVTANLQHPHILPLHDSGEAGRFVYYVMPYVEGESLREKLEREKELSIDETIEITKAVASALDYAHRHEVIHRDIKPENILLHDGQPVVADFGIALAVSAAGGTRLTETGLSLGTPQYMSPEQAMGDRVLDGRSDVYSLGCVVYEMLAGEPPYAGPTAQAVIAKVVTDTPRPVTDHRGTVPRHMALALNKALEKLPADRFTTAREFAEALTRPTVESVRMESPVQPVFGIAALLWRKVLLAGWQVAVLASLTLVAAGAAVWGWMRPAPSAQEFTARFVVALAPEERLAVASGGTLALSPDGRQIVYVGLGPGGPRLYVRAMDQLDARPIAGTDGAASPFFSRQAKKGGVGGGTATRVRRRLWPGGELGVESHRRVHANARLGSPPSPGCRGGAAGGQHARQRGRPGRPSVARIPSRRHRGGVNLLDGESGGRADRSACTHRTSGLCRRRRIAHGRPVRSRTARADWYLRPDSGRR